MALLVFVVFVVFVVLTFRKDREGVVVREWGAIVLSRDPKDTCCVVDEQFLQKATSSANNWEFLAVSNCRDPHSENMGSL